MKTFKNWLLALALIIAPLTANAQTYGPTNSSGSVSGASIVGTGGTTETLPTITDTLAGLGTTQTFTGTESFNGGVSTQGTVFTTAINANPLVMQRQADLTVASINASGGQILASTPGRKIYVQNMTVLASGTPSTAVSVYVECTDQATQLASFTASSLVTNTAVNAFSSAGNTAITPGKALVFGCGSGQGVFLSTIGTLATTTDVFVNMLYTVQ